VSVQVAIPSYNRHDRISKMTLQTLRNGGFPMDRVTVFVANEEQRRLYASCGAKLEISAPGIVPSRNFIHQAYPKGTRVVSLDDDIRSIVRATSPKKVSEIQFLESFFEQCFDAASAYKTKVWGGYPVLNPYFMKNRVSYGLKFIIGHMYGFVSDPSFPKIDDIYVAKHDYVVSIYAYKLYGGALRFDDVGCRTNMYKEPGGLQDFRTAELQRVNMEALLRDFPGLVAKKNGAGGMYAESEVRLVEPKRK